METVICENCSSIIPLNVVSLTGECPNCGIMFIQDSMLDSYTQSMLEGDEHNGYDEDM